MIRVLGIETSCDETAAASSRWTQAAAPQILSNIVLSQIEEHAAFGGVVPEIAARAHVEALDGIIEAALGDAGVTLADVDAIAATAGPGLVGGLIVGLMTAKALAAAAGKPLHAINHLEGHALTARLTDGLAFPYLLLLVSGGHTQVVLVRGVGDYERWATTIDDALGEAFDKTAKLIGLPYPGGPNVEKAALNGDPTRFDFPAPAEGRGAARLFVLRPEDGGAPGGDRHRAALANRTSPTSAPPSRRRSPTRWTIASAAASPASAANSPTSRSRRWWSPAASPPTPRSARTLEALCARHGFAFVAPPLALCTDNAAMIAWAGIERLREGMTDAGAMHFAPRSRWPLDEAAAPRGRLRAARSQGMTLANDKRESPCSAAAPGAPRWRITMRRAGHAVRLVGARRRDRSRRSATAAKTRAICRASRSIRRSSPPATPRRRCRASTTCSRRCRRSSCATALAAVARPDSRRRADRPLRQGHRARAPASCCRRSSTRCFPGNPVAALSGPSFATDVGQRPADGGRRRGARRGAGRRARRRGFRPSISAAIRPTI